MCAPTSVQQPRMRSNLLRMLCPFPTAQPRDHCPVDILIAHRAGYRAPVGNATRINRDPLMRRMTKGHKRRGHCARAEENPRQIAAEWGAADDDPAPEAKHQSFTAVVRVVA